MIIRRESQVFQGNKYTLNHGSITTSHTLQTKKTVSNLLICFKKDAFLSSITSLKCASDNAMKFRNVRIFTCKYPHTNLLSSFQDTVIMSKLENQILCPCGPRCLDDVPPQWRQRTALQFVVRTSTIRHEFSNAPEVSSNNSVAVRRPWRLSVAITQVYETGRNTIWNPD